MAKPKKRRTINTDYIPGGVDTPEGYRDSQGRRANNQDWNWSSNWFELTQPEANETVYVATSEGDKLATYSYVNGEMVRTGGPSLEEGTELVYTGNRTESPEKSWYGDEYYFVEVQNPETGETYWVAENWVAGEMPADDGGTGDDGTGDDEVVIPPEEGDDDTVGALADVVFETNTYDPLSSAYNTRPAVVPEPIPVEAVRAALRDLAARTNQVPVPVTQAATAEQLLGAPVGSGVPVAQQQPATNPVPQTQAAGMEGRIGAPVGAGAAVARPAGAAVPSMGQLGVPVATQPAGLPVPSMGQLGVPIATQGTGQFAPMIAQMGRAAQAAQTAVPAMGQLGVPIATQPAGLPVPSMGQLGVPVATQPASQPMPAMGQLGIPMPTQAATPAVSGYQQYQLSATSNPLLDLMMQNPTYSGAGAIAPTVAPGVVAPPNVYASPTFLGSTYAGAYQPGAYAPVSTTTTAATSSSGGYRPASSASPFGVGLTTGGEGASVVNTGTQISGGMSEAQIEAAPPRLTIFSPGTASYPSGVRVSVPQYTTSMNWSWGGPRLVPMLP